MLADRILALPGVDQLVASEENGSPEGAWGDRFFYVGPDRRQPFATIVEHDVPGFDEASQLDRPGVFRLNLDLGRAEFERVFGFPPKALRGPPARIRLRPTGRPRAAPGLRPVRLRQHRHARPADAARDRPATRDRPRPSSRPPRARSAPGGRPAAGLSPATSAAADVRVPADLGFITTIGPTPHVRERSLTITCIPNRRAHAGDRYACRVVDAEASTRAWVDASPGVGVPSRLYRSGQLRWCTGRLGRWIDRTSR